MEIYECPLCHRYDITSCSQQSHGNVRMSALSQVISLHDYEAVIKIVSHCDTVTTYTD